MKDNKKETKVICPECGNEVELEVSRVYEVGDIIECPFCGSELEVVANEDSLEIELIEEEK